MGSNIEFNSKPLSNQKVETKNKEGATSKNKNIPIPNNNGVSGFSLKSIKLKKEIIRKNKINNNKNISQDSFSNEDLIIHWTNYLKKIEANGNQNMLAILKMDSPKIVNEFNIEFSVANSINKVELNKELDTILPYMRENLNNYKINFNIIISEDTNKSFIYTTKEKYDKLKSINPAINILKKTFDLEI